MRLVPPAERDPPSGSVHLLSDTNGPLPDARPLPDPPTGYTLIERLGRGGMGDVYLAREGASERLVAMKFLRHPGSYDEYERFKIELRALAALEHPNIVRVFASDFDRADPYFTMEHLTGGPLSRWCTGAPVPPAEAVRAARAVGSGLAAAHAASIIHRDLKPSNIVCAADGTPKVVDFGLAKRLNAADPFTCGTGGLGTPEYMPPEQISRKNGAIGAWSDVYGLGATLYHLLTGRAPFAGRSPEEIVARVLADPPERPRAVRPDVPAALEAIVLKCLEKDPADRYPSMTELVADLDRFTTPGQVPLAPRFTRWRRARRWADRNRLALTAAAGAGALLGGTYLLGRGAHAPKPLVPPAAARPAPQMAATPVLLPVVPELTHERAVRDLRAGRRVELIGPNGPRVPVAWGLGPCDIVAPPDAPRTRFALRTADSSVLELMPDPGIDRYRIRAELRQDVRLPPKAERPESSPSHTGIALGHRRVPIGGGGTAHALVAIALCEFEGGDPARGRGVWWTDHGLIQIPLRQLRSFSHAGRGVPLEPTDAPTWRVLEVDVEPDRITVRHGDNTFTRNGPELNHGRAVVERLVRANRDLGPEVEFGPWSSRLPVGLWVRSSWVSFRSVSIEPLEPIDNE